ncbi:MAG TPA: DMT family transporter [Spirochaetota bacterium]|nr:DMT family transporter [Spirochaetota bacterium]HPI90323.1 DMT family transporter [Spirochaetota bacterium]HPR49412.1 DMT family transporter [Spirochaetota bacterium]
MTWFFLSLTAAFALATTDAMTKKFFGDLSAYEMGIFRLAYSLPFILLSLLVINIPALDSTFWACIAAGLPLEAIAFLLYMKAIRTSPLSLSLPFLAFTPLFITVTGWLVLGETVNLSGFAGIVLIVTGSYIMNISHAGRGPFEPFAAIIREPGSRYMLLTAFIYSFTSVIGKKAIAHSSPEFFAVAYYSLFTVLMISLLPFFSKANLKNLLSRPLKGLAVGTCLAVMVFTHTAAISMVQVAYMISIKRASLIFGVIYGAVMFREQNITERLAGALIMLAGAVVITFST